MAAGTCYQYSSLHSPKAIRLLKIHGPDLDDVPCCSLTEVDLDSRPSYTALSYTWGSAGREATQRGVTAEICEQIFCEGSIIPITRNLLDFFKDALRYHHHLHGVFIWIDAVCINQDCPDERASQIQMMEDIYIQAQSVLIWLGRAEQTTKLALEFMSVIEKADIPSLDARIDKLQPLDTFLGPLADSDDHWNALELMLARTWFSRTWILQEFCLANHFSLFCGQHEISFESFSKAASLSLHMPTSRTSRFINLPGNKMMDIIKLKKGIKERSFGNLFNILLYSSASNATEPKDMVYGILGMIKRSISERSPLQSMEVSYRLSTAEIYTKFTRLLLSEDPRLLLFHNHNPALQTCANVQLKLPSWVPNYTNRLNMAHGDFAFKPTNDAAKALSPSPLVVRRPDGVVFNAQRVDVIKERVVVFSGEIEAHWIASTLPDILRFLCAFEPVYFDGQPRSQALWLTLASGVISADLRTSNPAFLETLRLIFGLWVGMCLLALARKHSERSTDILNTYFRILVDLKEPIIALSESEMDFFPPPNMLASIPNLSTTADVLSTVEMFNRMMQDPYSITGSILFRTREGLLGKSTKNVQKDDEVWLIAGMPVPVVLRKAEGEMYLKKIDIAYVHGIMQGEFVDRMGLHENEIELI